MRVADCIGHPRGLKPAARRVPYRIYFPAILLLLMAGGVVQAAPPYYDRWETFDTTSGLPSDKVLSIYAIEDDVWVGTDHGLARYTRGKWRTYLPADGLAHPAVMAVAQDYNTGDLWIATMGGLNRYSAGRFETFNQLNSGLANDVVYGVTVVDGEVWVATAAGANRYQVAQNRWTIYDQTNTPMHETWCYSATGCADKVYLAVWGGGLLEYNPDKNRWKDYRDPDGEMEIDLFRNDGLVHDVVASVACDSAGRVWVATYFGLSTYDGRKWVNFMEHDSPLVSNFVNYVTARGRVGWIATDNGLNACDRKNWWTYRRDPDTGRGVVIWQPAGGPAERFTTKTIFPHNYILGVSFQGDDIWVATEKGVARGTRTNRRAPAAGASAEPVEPKKPVGAGG